MNIEKKKFISNYKKGIPQLLKKNLIADIETPFSSLLKISKNEKYSFLLESVEGGSKRGRYSLLGCDPDIIWKVEKNKATIKYLDHDFDYKLDNDPINNTPIGTVTISGTATEDQVLIASNNLTDEDGLGLVNYQWQHGQWKLIYRQTTPYYHSSGNNWATAKEFSSANVACHHPADQNKTSPSSKTNSTRFTSRYNG